MARLIYQWPADNIANTGSLSVNTGTPDSSYPIANLVDGVPSKPFKFTTTTGRVVWDFTIATSIDLVAIIHHNLTAGLEVRIQANATNAWGAPSLNQAFTIAAYQEDGFPFCPFLDLTALTRNFRYWSLVVVGTNAAPIAIGDVWLGATKRSFAVNISWGLNTDDDQLGIDHVTSYGVVTAYPFAVKSRHIIGEVETTDTGATDILAWHRKCKGRAYPSLMILDPLVNDAMLVRWMDQKISVTRNFRNSNTIALSWEEVSRGLVL